MTNIEIIIISIPINRDFTANEIACKAFPNKANTDACGRTYNFYVGFVARILNKLKIFRTIDKIDTYYCLEKQLENIKRSRIKPIEVVS